VKTLLDERRWNPLQTLGIQTFPGWETVGGDSLVDLVLWCHFCRRRRLGTCLLSLCLKPTLVRLLTNHCVPRSYYTSGGYCVRRKHTLWALAELLRDDQET